MKNKTLITTLGIIGVALVVGFLVYSVVEYKKSGIAEGGVVTCGNNQCFWSAHIHAYVPVTICGESYSFPKFKGALAEFHTHGEENVVHWHDKIPYDQKTKKFLESAPFALTVIFKNLDLPVDEKGLFRRENGAACEDGRNGVWKVFVNGAYYPDWRNYEWKDRDVIFFSFGPEGAEEVGRLLKENPLRFPFLGEG
ncbi:hypothetical protein C4571_02845 [Candidatus Parcubacteria bacterium]|nr:MAG: hypothetical protein C4571_02845 [Candidatus Parcubacteria bacterium]